MSLPPDLLRLPCREAVRLLALQQLGRARSTALRLDDEGDTEALHDFRVAIRRLRSIFKAWKRELKGRVRGKQRQGLREVQLATGGGRDAEVALAWLAAERGELAPAQLPGLDWLAGRLRERHDEAMAHARDGVRAAFADQDRSFVAGLEGGGEPPGKPDRFGKALSLSTRTHLDELRDLLTGALSAEDEERLHRARIAVKRLRYLVEPLRPHARSARPVVQATKRLQELLGDMNDAHVQQHELEERCRELEADEQSSLLLPGLEELRRRVGLKLEVQHAQLQDDWIDDGLARLEEPVQAFIDELAAG